MEQRNDLLTGESFTPLFISTEKYTSISIQKYTIIIK